MRTTIDRAGRVVVPKQLRDRLGLDGGSELDIDERDGAIEIRPRRAEIVLSEAEDGRLVLDAPPGTPRMTDADVRDLIDRSRR